MSLRDVELVNASVLETASLAEAASRLFASNVPALAVLDDAGRVQGVFSEEDLLKAVFPGYLTEVRHTAFLRDDAPSLDELARRVRGRPVSEFARDPETLRADDSKVHAAERFVHTRSGALPVVEGDRFIGMLSIAALCHARLQRAEEVSREAQS
ncbi:MAG TPA: CBS domain-containing protein [Gaiellaceae bacterium]|nr:CBS domain-containing protein [Gaiellaceae bacterium]